MPYVSSDAQKKEKATALTVAFKIRRGGEEEDRTPDLCIANAALSQLSYSPNREHPCGCCRRLILLLFAPHENSAFMGYHGKGTLIAKGALRKHVSNGECMMPGDRPF